MLLDSDCVPVTLFEVSDLWKELSLLRDGLTPTTTSSPKGHMASASSESVPKASKLSHGKWKHQVIGQGVLLVTEHNAEVNAGSIVAFASSHSSVVPEMRWRKLLQAIELGVGNEILQQEASRLTDLYWEYTNEFLSTRRPLHEIDSAECSAWIQTGLALTPFAGCVIKHTCDWTIAWSLIGEWTRRFSCLQLVNGHAMGTPGIYWKNLTIGDRPCSLGPERVLSKAATSQWECAPWCPTR